MLWVIFWVVVSFFAVVGLMETMLFFLETFAFRRISSIRNITLHVDLNDDVGNAEYILNTLSLLINRIDVGEEEIVLEISGLGISEEMRLEILQYCEKNPWVRFTENK